MSLLSRLRTVITLGRGVVKGLSETTAGDDPIALFGEWFESAKRSILLLPEAVTVATSNRDGSPSARMMLLKHFDDEGFVFYTNYESRKAEELLENPRAALVFHWPTLRRQVRVEGRVAKISAEESAAYFRTRPRGSRIAAWASKQSSFAAGRDEVERRFREYEAKFAAGDVPLPPFWGGFRVKPSRIEFWPGRINRWHDRLCYTRDGGAWRITRLYP